MVVNMPTVVHIWAGGVGKFLFKGELVQEFCSVLYARRAIR
jgi:hypothetical protein